MGAEIFRKAGDGDQRGGIHRQTGVLQADEGNEQADTHGDAPLQSQGDGVEDGFTHVCQGKDDENDTLNEDSQQCDLPGVAHAKDHGVGKIGVQTHTGGQGEGKVCHQRHGGGTDKGGDGGCQQDGGRIHTCLGKDAGVYGQDVSHCHEGGDTGHDFGLYIGLVLGEFKQFLEHSVLPFFLFGFFVRRKDSYILPFY